MPRTKVKRPRNKAELAAALREVNATYERDPYSDYEACHNRSDELLLAYINDPAVTEAFEDTPKYSA